MGIKVKVPPRIEVLSRIIVLHEVVKELARHLGAVESDLEVIKKGVLDQKMISKIIFYYYSTSGEIVCCSTISIDWEMHKVLAETEQGGMFSVDPSLSMAEQLAEAFLILTDHVKNMCDRYHVTKICTHYVCQPEITADAKKLSDAYSYLGLVAVKAPRYDLRFEEGMSADVLKELGIRIEHR